MEMVCLNIYFEMSSGEGEQRSGTEAGKGCRLDGEVLFKMEKAKAVLSNMAATSLYMVI